MKSKENSRKLIETILSEIDDNSCFSASLYFSVVLKVYKESNYNFDPGIVLLRDVNRLLTDAELFDVIPKNNQVSEYLVINNHAVFLQNYGRWHDALHRDGACNCKFHSIDFKELQASPMQGLKLADNVLTTSTNSVKRSESHLLCQYIEAVYWYVNIRLILILGSIKKASNHYINMREPFLHEQLLEAIGFIDRYLRELSISKELENCSKSDDKQYSYILRMFYLNTQRFLSEVNKHFKSKNRARLRKDMKAALQTYSSDLFKSFTKLTECLNDERCNHLAGFCVTHIAQGDLANINTNANPRIETTESINWLSDDFSELLSPIEMRILALINALAFMNSELIV